MRLTEQVGQNITVIADRDNIATERMGEAQNVTSITGLGAGRFTLYLYENDALVRRIEIDRTAEPYTVFYRGVHSGHIEIWSELKQMYPVELPPDITGMPAPAMQQAGTSSLITLGLILLLAGALGK